MMENSAREISYRVVVKPAILARHLLRCAGEGNLIAVTPAVAVIPCAWSRRRIIDDVLIGRGVCYRISRSPLSTAAIECGSCPGRWPCRIGRLRVERGKR